MKSFIPIITIFLIIIIYAGLQIKLQSVRNNKPIFPLETNQGTKHQLEANTSYTQTFINPYPDLNGINLRFADMNSATASGSLIIQVQPQDFPKKTSKIPIALIQENPLVTIKFKSFLIPEYWPVNITLKTENNTSNLPSIILNNNKNLQQHPFYGTFSIDNKEQSKQLLFQPQYLQPHHLTTNTFFSISGTIKKIYQQFNHGKQNLMKTTMIISFIGIWMSTSYLLSKNLYFKK